MISGIVLAAGESKRMGKPKQLLSFGGATILEHVVDNLRQCRIGEIIIVLGHEWQRIAARFDNRPVRMVINPDYRMGMGTSLAQGILSADEKAQAFLVALGDQPLVRVDIVNALIDAYQRGGKGIAIPSFEGLPGHPVIFDKKYRQDLLRLQGDVGGKDVVKSHPEDVLHIEVDSASVIYDIDDWDDYQKQLEEYTASMGKK